MSKYSEIKFKLETVIITIIAVAKSIPDILNAIKSIKNNIIKQRKQIYEKLNNIAEGKEAISEL